MPNRLLKEGIVDSSAIDGLTAEEEVFFYRLLVVSDDFGRMDARPAILKSRCFPLKESPKMLDKIDGWLLSLVRQGLVICYQVDDKPYLQILKWEQRVRSKPKYPSADCGQVSVICQSDDGLGKGKGLGKGASNKVTFDEANKKFIGTENFISFWKETYPAVDVDQELKRMVAWLVSHPKNLKSDYPRFINTWLDKSQNKAPSIASSKPLPIFETRTTPNGMEWKHPVAGWVANSNVPMPNQVAA